MARASTDRPASGESRLVGRAREIDALRERLDTGARLVTVTGAFGVGKTALVREVIRLGVTRDAEPVPVALVELGDAPSEDRLLDAVAHALGRGGRAAKGASSRALAAAGALVLVLDPFDRWIELGAVLARWLDEAPELSIVVVSRARLGLPDEELVEVAPLSVGEGVQLLEVLGARHRGGSFVPSDAERAALTRIAEHLDAIPLALELAAPRLAVMGPEALLYRLENRWEVLRRGTASAAAGDRSATLEASLSWSLELLEPALRSLLADLTVFVGGLTIDAAEAVLLAPAGLPVLDALQSLRARSLVVAGEDEGSGELRLSLLSSVRDLVQRELGPERAAELADRHAAYYVELAEREAREAEERGSARARARIARERGNLLAVAQRILGRGAPSARAAERALRALSAIGPVLLAEGTSAELARDLERGLAVAQGSGADPRLIARAMLLRAEVRAERGDRTGEGRDLAEALVLSHHAGDAPLEVRALLAAAATAADVGEASRAASAVARARALGGASLDAHVLARVLLLEGAIAERAGDAIGARLAYEESLARSRALGLASGEIDAGRALAILDLREGDAASAESRAASAAGLAASLGHARTEAILRAVLGAAAQLRGELAKAIAHHDDAARLAQRAALDAELPWLAGLAAIARAEAGDRGEARAAFAEARAGAIADADFALVFSIARARLARAADRPAEVDAERAHAATLAPRARDSALVMLAATGTAPETRSGLVALALRVPSAGATPSTPPPDDGKAVQIGPSAVWFRAPGGARVDLSRRKPLRLLLDRLATERERGGGGLPWDALLEAGWPGEKMRADAGAHRVRVAISTLRKMGLADVLRTDESGYALAPGVVVERAKA